MGEILNRYTQGDRVGDEDEPYVKALFWRHPNAEEKAGCGIDHFAVDFPPVHPGRCFYVVRLDGNRDDFSIGTCLKGVEPDHRIRVSKALREAVKPDIDEWRTQYFKKYSDEDGFVLCPLTDELIYEGNGDVDHHAPTFREIVQFFLERKGLTFDDVELERGKGNTIERVIADSELIDEFKAFHKAKMNLRFIEKKAHQHLRRLELR